MAGIETPEKFDNTVYYYYYYYYLLPAGTTTKTSGVLLNPGKT
jgi:hypothetical protein